MRKGLSLKNEMVVHRRCKGERCKEDDDALPPCHSKGALRPSKRSKAVWTQESGAVVAI